MDGNDFDSLVRDLKAAREEVDKLFWWESLFGLGQHRKRIRDLTAALENLERFNTQMSPEQTLASIRETTRASLTALVELRRQTFHRVLCCAFFLALILAALAVLVGTFLANRPAKAVTFPSTGVVGQHHNVCRAPCGWRLWGKRGVMFEIDVVAGIAWGEYDSLIKALKLRGEDGTQRRQAPGSPVEALAPGVGRSPRGSFPPGHGEPVPARRRTGRENTPEPQAPGGITSGRP